MREYLVALGIAGCGRIEFDPRSDAGVGDDVALRCIDELNALGDQACVRRGDGSVWCWGNNGRGALGDGTFTPHLTASPTLFPPAVALVGGEQHTCAIDRNGSLWCAGGGIEGQLGTGGNVDNPVPERVSLQAAVAFAAASQFNTCARLADGTGWCWGHNQNEQLGYFGPSSNVPVQVPALANTTAFTTGDNFVCVLKPDRTVECWGKNDAGELGDGTTAPPSRGAPARIIGVTDPIKDVRAGCHRHACALTELGAVWCWGENAFGQVDSGSTAMPIVSTPVRVTGIPSDVVQIALGAFHTCARAASHEVWCWGDNSFAKLGLGHDTPMAVPARVLFSGVALDLQLSCGTSFVVTPNGIVAWGEGHTSGTGSTAFVPAPTPIDVPCP